MSAPLVTLQRPFAALQRGAAGGTDPGAFPRPYVISWNLTYRCNLACEHCYLDAGPAKVEEDPAFADRAELSTEQCLEVVDQIAAFAPEALVILTGGEPLLRRDLLDIVRHASARSLWVVVGSNGVLITENLAATLLGAGVRGMSLSLDALDAGRHDAFRRVRGAFNNTVRGAQVLAGAGMPFIIQTTVGAHNHHELDSIADFAHAELGATVWNLYFLVPTGRGGFVSDLEPAQYDAVLDRLRAVQERYLGRMLVNAKCAPHYVRELLQRDPASPFLKRYTGGAGGCPAGTHYMGIRPNGEVTPCPYLPVFGGSLLETQLEELWTSSGLFQRIRRRSELGDRCGACELQSLCGGCRARAYGATGDLMAEDPLCSHEPGSLAAVLPKAVPVEYGGGGPAGRVPMTWDPAAEQRMQRVPAFVRSMVMRRVEESCRQRGADRVTVELLEEIRARMPTPKLFGRP
jgi:radical SAM protein with 4Fe4S-binding SPASM domain